MEADRQGRRESFQREARARLDAALRERDRARNELDDADAALRQAVRDAEASGVTLVELARLTGWHRNTIRTIVTDG